MTKKLRRSARKPTRKSTRRKSKSISFFIGVITVIALAFLVFQYAQNNNYKQVLGKKTEILKQIPVSK